MKLKQPFVGILAFIVVLLAMPLGHAVMIIMEKTMGEEALYVTALVLGLVGLLLLIPGFILKNDTLSTLTGLLSGLFVWTGWIEFGYVYYAHRYNVAPLVENGQVVTKPEYLIMPSSFGFLIVFLVYYLFSSNTGCRFFSWLQEKFMIRKSKTLVPQNRNSALVTFFELIVILWFFYLVLLLVYDKRFFGDHHPAAYIVAFGSFFWSGYLFVQLIKIKTMGYAIRYAIPTVVIFWNFVEVLGRWNLFKEIWIEPGKYRFEMVFLSMVLALLLFVTLVDTRKKGSLQNGKN